VGCYDALFLGGGNETARPNTRHSRAIRRMDSARGGKIVDHIVDVQPSKMRLTYERVESPFAVTSYRGTVEVFESFDGLGVVVWTIDFESTPENSPVVNAQLEAGLARGVEGMKADLAAAM
jgi:Polyketide cyclase / dehydrase and lipid transport